MSYEASTMNPMQLTYAADDGTAAYTHTAPPPSSPPPSPTAAYNNPNGVDLSGGADSGESNYPLAVTEGINVSGSEVVKRKRGRPRKNVADGSIPPASVSGDLSSPTPTPGKRPRGRPIGSTNKQYPAASGLPGVGFMPHILDVKSGEDVLGRLVWFSQNSTRALCIISANGTISNVTLQQASMSGGTVTYEGRFEILSLSGSFTTSENDIQHSRIRGLTVALSGPDGRVLGGNVVGLLIAASPVQVIIGSFVPANRKQLKEQGMTEAEAVNGSANPASGSLSESSGGALGSPVGQGNNSNRQAWSTCFEDR